MDLVRELDSFIITSASKELSSAAKLFSKKMCDEIKSITEKMNEKVRPLQ